MPTYDYYIRCPYFMRMKGSVITCEDVRRHFESSIEANIWAKNHCVPYVCPYALGLDEMYERIDTMDERDARIEKLEYLCKCKDAEITKITKKINSVKNDIDKARRDEKAALYLAEANKKIYMKLEGRLYLEQEKRRGLENFIGYLCKKLKLKKFKLADVRDYGKKYETKYMIPDYEKDTIIVEYTERKTEDTHDQLN